MATSTTPAAPAPVVTVNRVKDFIERVGWTFIQAFVGAMVAFLIKDGTDIDWAASAYAAVIAALIAAGKVLVAQQFGSSNDGAAIPGGVIEEGRVAPTR